MRLLFAMASATSFIGAIMHYLSTNDWYGAMGWALLGFYQFMDFTKYED